MQGMCDTTSFTALVQPDRSVPVCDPLARLWRENRKGTVA